jgi:hypothetical protein
MRELSIVMPRRVVQSASRPKDKARPEERASSMDPGLRRDDAMSAYADGSIN